MAEATNPITPASKPRVGEDWVLVPREPTPEMLEAAQVRQTDYPADHDKLARAGWSDGRDIAVRKAYARMIASAPTPPDRVGEEVGRDHVVSARLIPWEPESLGGVDLTFESGLRVALPLSEPEATPQSSPSQTPVAWKYEYCIPNGEGVWEQRVSLDQPRDGHWIRALEPLFGKSSMHDRAETTEAALRTLQAAGEVR